MPTGGLYVAPGVRLLSFCLRVATHSQSDAPRRVIMEESCPHAPQALDKVPTAPGALTNL